MKKLKMIRVLVFLFLITGTLFYCIRTEVSPPEVLDGELFDSPADWEMNEQTQTLTYTMQLPAGNSTEKLLLLQSHWIWYDISVDGNEVWQNTGNHAGAVHLFSLPQGSTLRIRFLQVTDSAVNAIKTSRIHAGDKNGIYSFIIRENFHALVFTILALILGVLCIGAGLYLRSVLTSDIRKCLLSLGGYILLTGLWILTDSRLLVLVTQKTGFVETLSFIAFFLLPLPLLNFTRQIIRVEEKAFRILKNLFWFTLALYMAHYVFGILSLTVILVTEHCLMMITIITMLRSGFREIRRRRNKKVFRVILGYITFAVFSILAFVFYYMGNAFGYSVTYVLGILGFIFFLATAACTAIYEQLEENADIAVQAKMACTDMMTGLGNRTAFLQDQIQDQNYWGTFAYIMVDANNLKKINDNLGHHKGDELLTKLAKCILNIDGVKEGKYRIGGDEFVIRLRGISLQETYDYMELLRKDIAQVNANSDIEISAALGCAWTNEKVKDLEKLLQKADTAMYENKVSMKQNRK